MLKKRFLGYGNSKSKFHDGSVTKNDNYDEENENKNCNEVVENFENENRMLLDDFYDHSGEFTREFTLSTKKEFHALQEGWTTVKHGSKSAFPEIIWTLLCLSKPFTDQDLKPLTNNVRRVIDIWKLSLPDRWRLYKYWLEKFCSKKAEKFCEWQEHHFNVSQKLRELESLKYQYIFKDAKVLGMTTSGAAKHQSILNAVKPKIVIVEEAAEVLESHIVASLSNGCQHLILIGDHHQLRPNPAVYELAKHYSFDVSLFERLINNNFEHAVLKQQHRMRPEIADTLMPFFMMILKTMNLFIRMNP